jgi:thiamine transport system substrate-binding protein
MTTRTRTSITGRNGGRPLRACLALTAALALGLTGCAAGGSNGEGASDKKVTLVVHDSFPNDEFAAAASAATGYEVTVVSAGDGGELSSQLVLTKGAPIADAFFGIDNSFASRIVDNEVAEPFAPAEPMPPRAAELAAQLVPGGSDDAASIAAFPMVPIDLGATCINIDPAWFEEQGIEEPASYEDLAGERYRGLTVVLDPTASSTGASFLIGTVAEFGEDGFEGYWSALAANDARIAQGWDEAYYTHFTQGGDGTYPIVLSYSSSPAYTVAEDGSASTTKALLDTCSSQIEYAGVLAGAANPEGAKAVVEYMLSREFQDTIAETMYMYPVDEEAFLPAEWTEFAPLPSAPRDLSPTQIGAGLDDWLKAWSAAVS